jgi:preprotein translocase subunit Sec63
MPKQHSMHSMALPQMLVNNQASLLWLVLFNVQSSGVLYLTVIELTLDWEVWVRVKTGSSAHTERKTEHYRRKNGP